VIVFVSVLKAKFGLRLIEPALAGDAIITPATPTAVAASTPVARRRRTTRFMGLLSGVAAAGPAVVLKY
jgi:hypothetical protein